MVQAFLKKWWVESDFKAPNLPLSLRLKGLSNKSKYKFIKQIFLLNLRHLLEIFHQTFHFHFPPTGTDANNRQLIYTSFNLQSFLLSLSFRPESLAFLFFKFIFKFRDCQTWIFIVGKRKWFHSVSHCRTRVSICKQKDAGPGTAVPPGNYQEEIIHYCLPLHCISHLTVKLCHFCCTFCIKVVVIFCGFILSLRKWHDVGFL